MAEIDHDQLSYKRPKSVNLDGSPATRTIESTMIQRKAKKKTMRFSQAPACQEAPGCQEDKAKGEGRAWL
jgi:hypothetical protein